MRYLIQRLFHGIALLVLVSILSFAMAELAPGDFLAGLELQEGVDQQMIDTLRERYGLDRSLAARYWLWMASVGRGELGFSVSYQQPALTLLAPRALNTLLLAATALLLGWVCALPLGVWSAYRRRGPVDRLAGGAASLLLATPTVLLGLAFLLVAAEVELFPIGGTISLDHEEMGRVGRLIDRVRHLALPALALALGSFPVIFRHTRSAVEGVLDKPFLRAARAQGVSTRRVLFGHALKAAANPLVSLFGLSLAGLLSGSFLIEVIFSWPGLGPLMWNAIMARDVHLVIGAVLLSSACLIAGNLVGDLLLLWIDPRIKAER